MEIKTLKRSIFQRIFGICATKAPKDSGCWSFSDGKITLDLSRIPELSQPDTGIRLEGKSLPKRVLVMHSNAGSYYAFHNKCSHAGRRIDPVPKSDTIQCCSVGKATFDYKGTVLSGSAQSGIKTFPVQVEDGKLLITL